MLISVQKRTKWVRAGPADLPAASLEFSELNDFIRHSPKQILISLHKNWKTIMLLYFQSHCSDEHI